MNLLLDTHLLIWSAGNSERLSPLARSLIEDENNQLFFSAASVWETAIKHHCARVDFPLHPAELRRGLLENGFSEIPVTGDHAVCVRALPMLHKDPFDRVLVAQAMVEGLTLLTTDSLLAQYMGPVQSV